MCLEDDEAPINISAEDEWFKLWGTVANPLLFMKTKEDISEGKTRGGEQQTWGSQQS